MTLEQSNHYTPRRSRFQFAAALRWRVGRCPCQDDAVLEDHPLLTPTRIPHRSSTRRTTTRSSSCRHEGGRAEKKTARSTPDSRLLPQEARRQPSALQSCATTRPREGIGGEVVSTPADGGLLLRTTLKVTTGQGVLGASRARHLQRADSDYSCRVRGCSRDAAGVSANSCSTSSTRRGFIAL